jgi:hypothetical protein
MAIFDGPMTMPTLKLQDDQWIVYQPDGAPLPWPLAAEMLAQAQSRFNTSPEQVATFLNEQFLQALSVALATENWQGNFNGCIGEIELTSPHDDLSEAKGRMLMQAALDEAVMTLLDALEAD